MSILHHKFGETTIAKVSNPDELRQMLVDPWFESETIIIKPNWVSDELANFTSSKTLRILLEAIDSHFVVTESHILLRHAREGKNFTVGDKAVNLEMAFNG